MSAETACRSSAPSKTLPPYATGNECATPQEVTVISENDAAPSRVTSTSKASTSPSINNSSSSSPSIACTFPGCTKIFTLRSNMRRHLFTHTTPPQHQCAECPAAFHRRADLNTHMRVHTGEKPKECKECGRRFARGSDLRSHERTHMGVKRWKCECGKEFSRRFDLRKHKARCEVLIVAGGGKLGGAGRVGLANGSRLYPKVPAVISVDTSFFENNSYICGVISDVDTEYAIERGLGGEQKTGGMTPTVISGSESDGEGVPGGGGSLSEQGKSTSIREEDIKAGEALLGLMTRS
ncbi:hypothetical protein TrCOL_g715 [Triparma columacea]|uniref:C2H2-type domain-containing protein n=1 Tax=Triparma columacea TaxID=722753 RepID=A0A9W7GIQ6_9STRA|nr:hypothetical protein TrCOL_g715 [Triparma columacea]